MATDKYYSAEKRKVRRDYARASLIMLKGNKCEVCGIKNLPMCCYEFHHIDAASKTEDISRLITDYATKAKLEEEAAKCKLLCIYCHRKLHFGEVTAKQMIKKWEKML